MDSSITLNGEPATNSMLNIYLDQKLQEVYSQYLQERLTRPESSLGPSLLPQFHQPSLNQIIPLHSTDVSLEPETRPCQKSIGRRYSSHFSTPVLRISDVSLENTDWTHWTQAWNFLWSYITSRNVSILNQYSQSKKVLGSIPRSKC